MPGRPLPRINSFDIPLTSAGQLVVHGFAGICRLIKAVDASGAAALSTAIRVKAGDAVGDWIPLAYGNALKLKVAAEVTIAWDAQPGVVATIFQAWDPDIADVDADPPVRLVVGEKAGAIAAAAVDVDTTAGGTQIAAVNSSRKAVTLFNNGTDTVYLGPAGVTAAAGMPLAAGAYVAFTETTAAIYGIAASGTQEIRVLSEG